MQRWFYTQIGELRQGEDCISLNPTGTLVSLRKCSKIPYHIFKGWYYFKSIKILMSFHSSKCLAVAENSTRLVLEPCSNNLMRMKWNLENFDEKLFKEMKTPCQIKLVRNYT